MNKDKIEKEKFTEKTHGIEMEFFDLDKWNKGREINKDPYGNACYEYAEGWAKLMQFEMSNGKALEDCAKDTSFQLGFMGISGFMYGCAVGILSECWLYGEQLRKWHNKDYGQENSKGVVNPAILTIK